MKVEASALESTLDSSTVGQEHSSVPSCKPTRYSGSGPERNLLTRWLSSNQGISLIIGKPGLRMSTLIYQLRSDRAAKDSIRQHVDKCGRPCLLLYLYIYLRAKEVDATTPVGMLVTFLDQRSEQS